MIRIAEEKDLVDMMDIYNEAVRNTTATFDIEERTLSDRIQWFLRHSGKYCLYVAEEDRIKVGYAAISRYRERGAFEPTVEFSVYVLPEYSGQGIGTQLMERALEGAKEHPEITSVVSLVTGENEISIHLHEKFGFRYCGKIQRAGVKFGRELDLLIYQLMV